MDQIDAGREARRTRRFRSADRAMWWAVLRTERDRRLALAARRPITAANLRRLLARRWATVVE